MKRQNDGFVSEAMLSQAMANLGADQVELIRQAERERVKKALLDKLHATYGVDGGAALVIVENDEMGGVSQRHGLSEVKRIIEAL